MQTLNGGFVSVSVIGCGVKECVVRKADVLFTLACRSEVLEDVFLSNAEATALAQQLLFVVSENKKKRGS